MKKTKQIIALLLCLVMVVAGSVFATVAYLTAQESVTNTFTVGKIDITLDETDVDENGDPIPGADRVTENEYHLIPGSTYTKDPTITVEAESEESYVRMLVEVKSLGELMEAIPAADHADYYADGIFLLEKLCGGYDNTKWIYKGFDDATNTYEFRYFETVDGFDTEGNAADAVLPALFNTITVPGFITETGIEGLNNVEINVTGQAIQAANFDDEAAAWAAFDVQNG